MELQEVTKAQAVELEKLGFNWISHNSFWVEEEALREEVFTGRRVRLPYQELVCKWLRDVHKIFIRIWTPSKTEFYFESYVQYFPYKSQNEMNFVKRSKSYEICVGEAITVAIERLKQDGITTSK